MLLKIDFGATATLGMLPLMSIEKQSQNITWRRIVNTKVRLIRTKISKRPETNFLYASNGKVFHSFSLHPCVYKKKFYKIFFDYHLSIVEWKS